MSSVYVVVNPVARGFSERKLRIVTGVLKKRYNSVQTFVTSQKGDAEGFARELAEKKEPLIVVMGGDGTLNEVINAVAYTQTAIGFIPAGTTNVAAKEFGIPETPHEAAEHLLKGSTKELKLGKIDKRYFLLMAGAGYDGETVYGLSPFLKKLSGKGAYIFSGLMVMLKGLKDFRVRINRETYRCYTAVFCNTACYGGTFKLCPDASAMSERLHVLLMLKGTRRELLKHALRVILKQPLRGPALLFKETDRVEILDSPHIQTDGDYFGKGPVMIEAAPGALKMVL